MFLVMLKYIVDIAPPKQASIWPNNSKRNKGTSLGLLERLSAYILDYRRL